MLRKLFTLAVTAVLAKKAWDQMRAAVPPDTGTAPLVTPDDLEVASAAGQPVAPESPMHLH